MELEEPEGFTVLSHIPIPKLVYDKPATTYTLVEMNDPNTGKSNPLRVGGMHVMFLDQCVCSYWDVSQYAQV